MADKLEIPDLTEKVIGFRTFRLSSSGTKLLSLIPNIDLTLESYREILYSLASIPWADKAAYLEPFEKSWRPGINVAECRVTCRLDDKCPAPAPDHDCGFNAYHSFREMCNSGYGFVGENGFYIPAVISAWGRIEVHNHGFRSQYAQVLLLGYRKRNKDAIIRLAEEYDARAVPIKHLEREAAKLGLHPVPEQLRPEGDIASKSPYQSKGWARIWAFLIIMGLLLESFYGYEIASHPSIFNCIWYGFLGGIYIFLEYVWIKRLRYVWKGY